MERREREMYRERESKENRREVKGDEMARVKWRVEDGVHR